jgi:hypothetical protein
MSDNTINVVISEEVLNVTISEGFPSSTTNIQYGGLFITDGTPSYSSFQWKPSTFKYYAVKYNLLKGEDVDTDEEVMENMFNRDIQISIITEMIGDKSIKWNIQFPDCTKNKIGIPPNY